MLTRTALEVRLAQYESDIILHTRIFKLNSRKLTAGQMHHVHTWAAYENIIKSMLEIQGTWSHWESILPRDKHENAMFPAKKIGEGDQESMHSSGGSDHGNLDRSSLSAVPHAEPVLSKSLIHTFFPGLHRGETSLDAPLNLEVRDLLN